MVYFACTFWDPENMNKLKKIVLVILCVFSVTGCSETMLELEVDTNQTIDLIIPTDTNTIEIPIIVPDNIAESGMTFAVESAFDHLLIELFDPNNNLVAVNTDEQGYFFPKNKVSPKANRNKWGFNKIIDPMSGKWRLRFTLNTNEILKKVTLHLSIGLVPKYSAFIKPYKNQVQVGESSLIQLQFSSHGTANNIEGHIIEVFDEHEKKVDEIAVSNQLTRADSTQINATESTYLAVYTPQESGQYTFMSTFEGTINGQVFTQKATNRQLVVESAVEPTSLSLSSYSVLNKNARLTLKFNVRAVKSLWLVVKITLSQNGEYIQVSRNREMKKDERAEFVFELNVLPTQELSNSPLVIEYIELIDFDVQGSASLLRSIPLKHIVTESPIILQLR